MRYISNLLLILAMPFLLAMIVGFLFIVFWFLAAIASVIGAVASVV